MTLLSACSLPKLGITPSPRGASRGDKCVMCASRALTTWGLSARVSPQLSRVTLGNWKHTHTHTLLNPTTRPLRSLTRVLFSSCRVQGCSTQDMWSQGRPHTSSSYRPLVSPLSSGRCAPGSGGLMLIWRVSLMCTDLDVWAPPNLHRTRLPWVIQSCGNAACRGLQGVLAQMPARSHKSHLVK